MNERSAAQPLAGEAARPSTTYRNLSPGDPAPWFQQASTSNPRYVFDTAAGRYLVLCFFGSAGDAAGQEVIRAIAANRRCFDDDRISIFGVTVDPQDQMQGRVRESMPGVRYFWDFDRRVSRLYGAVPLDAAESGPVPLRRIWVVLDPTLRVMKLFALSDHAALFTFLSQLPRPDRFAGVELQAPVLLLPQVLEPELCRELIDLYEAYGGRESGFMREIGGRTVGVQDSKHKVRKDYDIVYPELIARLQARVQRRIVPEILKVHQLRVTRMERYIVSCYAAEDGGHFRAHRDNTTAGTAHRRFAVSINLNADFKGGEVNFPEYGSRSFKPPPGGAVVFSCSLLHAVSRVTSGRRYAFLPFLYDDAAARLREENAAQVEGGSAYRA